MGEASTETRTELSPPPPPVQLRAAPPWCFSYHPRDDAIRRLLEAQKGRARAPERAVPGAAPQGWHLVPAELAGLLSGMTSPSQASSWGQPAGSSSPTSQPGRYLTLLARASPATLAPSIYPSVLARINSGLSEAPDLTTVRLHAIHDKAGKRAAQLRLVQQETVSRAHASAHRANALVGFLEDTVNTDAYDQRQNRRLRATIQGRVDQLAEQVVCMYDVMDAPVQKGEIPEQLMRMVSAGSADIRGDGEAGAGEESENTDVSGADGQTGRRRSSLLPEVIATNEQTVKQARRWFSSGDSPLAPPRAPNKSKSKAFRALLGGTGKQALAQIFEEQRKELATMREALGEHQERHQDNSEHRMLLEQIREEKRELAQLKDWVVAQRGQQVIPTAVAHVSPAVVRPSNAASAQGSDDMRGSVVTLSSAVPAPQAARVVTPPAAGAEPVREVLKEGSLSVVACMVKEPHGLGEAWSEDGEVLFGALRRVQAMLGALAVRCGGWVSRSDPAVGVVCCFARPRAALHFALGAQADLVREGWPPRLLRQNCFKPQRHRGALLWCGPRVAMSLHINNSPLFSERNPHGADLAGADIAVSLNMLTLACGGECLVTSESWKLLSKETISIAGGPLVKEVPLTQRQELWFGGIGAQAAQQQARRGSAPLPPALYRLVPASLGERLEQLPALEPLLAGAVGHGEEQAQSPSKGIQGAAHSAAAPPAQPGTGKPGWGNAWAWQGRARGQPSEAGVAAAAATQGRDLEHVDGKAEISSVPRPPGSVRRCVVVVSVAEMQRLSQKHPDAAAEALYEVRAALRDSVAKQGAKGPPEDEPSATWVRPVLVRLDRDEIEIVFFSAPEAVRWALRFQKDLLELTLPPELNTYWFGGSDPSHTDPAVWKGVRVAVGIHYADLNQKRHPVTGFAQLLGGAPKYAHALAEAGRGGELLVSDEVANHCWGEHVEAPDLDPAGGVPSVRLAADREGFEGMYRVWQVQPRALEKRHDALGRVRLQRLKVLKRAMDGAVRTAEVNEAGGEEEFARASIMSATRAAWVQTDPVEEKEEPKGKRAKKAAAAAAAAVSEAAESGAPTHNAAPEERVNVLGQRDIAELLRACDDKPFGAPPRGMRDLLNARVSCPASERAMLRRLMVHALNECLKHAREAYAALQSKFDTAMTNIGKLYEDKEKLSAKLRMAQAVQRFAQEPHNAPDLPLVTKPPPTEIMRRGSWVMAREDGAPSPSPVVEGRRSIIPGVTKMPLIRQTSEGWFNNAGLLSPTNGPSAPWPAGKQPSGTQSPEEPGSPAAAQQHRGSVAAPGALAGAPAAAGAGPSVFVMSITQPGVAGGAAPPPQLPSSSGQGRAPDGAGGEEEQQQQAERTESRGKGGKRDTLSANSPSPEPPALTPRQGAQQQFAARLAAQRAEMQRRRKEADAAAADKRKVAFLLPQPKQHGLASLVASREPSPVADPWEDLPPFTPGRPPGEPSAGSAPETARQGRVDPSQLPQLMGGDPFAPRALRAARPMEVPPPPPPPPPPAAPRRRSAGRPAPQPGPAGIIDRRRAAARPLLGQVYETRDQGGRWREVTVVGRNGDGTFRCVTGRPRVDKGVRQVKGSDKVLPRVWAHDLFELEGGWQPKPPPGLPGYVIAGHLSGRTPSPPVSRSPSPTPAAAAPGAAGGGPNAPSQRSGSLRHLQEARARRIYQLTQRTDGPDGDSVWAADGAAAGDGAANVPALPSLLPRRPAPAAPEPNALALAAALRGLRDEAQASAAAASAVPTLPPLLPGVE